MSNFNCEYCGKPIIDTPRGHVTGCEHYPLSGVEGNGAWGNTYRLHLGRGEDHGYAAFMADTYCNRYLKDR